MLWFINKLWRWDTFSRWPRHYKYIFSVLYLENNFFVPFLYNFLLFTVYFYHTFQKWIFFLWNNCKKKHIWILSSKSLEFSLMYGNKIFEILVDIKIFILYLKIQKYHNSFELNILWVLFSCTCFMFRNIKIYLFNITRVIYYSLNSNWHAIYNAIFYSHISIKWEIFCK